MTEIRSFLEAPAIAPVWGLIVLTILDWGLGSYRAWSEGRFTWQETANVLRTTVLDRVVPVTFLGAAAFLAPASEVVAGVSPQTVLYGVYLAAATGAIVELLAGFRDKWASARVARATARNAAKVVTQTSPTKPAPEPADKPIGKVPPSGPTRKG